MARSFTLEFWIDADWYVGQLREIPGVFGQGESLDELVVNVRDAYHLVMEETADFVARDDLKTIEIEI